MLWGYVFRRALHGALLLWAVSLMTFAALYLAPGDYFDEARLTPHISAETAEALRQQHGVGQTMPVRYARWLGGVCSGDFGMSITYDMPAGELLGVRARNTLGLTITALVLTWLIGFPVAVWAALRPGSAVDRALSAGTSAVLAMSELLLACGALIVASRTGWLPVRGMTSSGFDEMPLAARLLDLARHAILPATILAIGALPSVLRHVRSAVLQARSASFVEAARAHGIPERRIVWRYVIPAAANPFISLLGLQVGALLSASLLVEVLLGWPGLGPLLMDAVSARDAHVVAGAVLLSAALLIGGSLIADLLLYACDPRIRVES